MLEVKENELASLAVDAWVEGREEKREKEGATNVRGKY
jgi:hypothetical protein